MTMSGMKRKPYFGGGAMEMDDEYQRFKRNAPEPDPTRPGWLRQRAGGEDSYISWPEDARPHIQVDHIDGPVVHFRNGEMHWLTWRERIALYWGYTDADKLEYKYKPVLRGHW